MAEELTNRRAGLTGYLVVLGILNGLVAIGNLVTALSAQQSPTPAVARTSPYFFSLAACGVVNIGGVIAIWYRKKWGMPLLLVSGVFGIANIFGLFGWGSVFLVACGAWLISYLLLVFLSRSWLGLKGS